MKTQNTTSKRLLHWFFILIIATLLMTLFLIKGRAILTHLAPPSAWEIERLNTFQISMEAGNFPPLWQSTALSGRGAPLFLLTPPLTYLQWYLLGQYKFAYICFLGLGLIGSFLAFATSQQSLLPSLKLPLAAIGACCWVPLACYITIQWQPLNSPPLQSLALLASIPWLGLSYGLRKSKYRTLFNTFIQACFILTGGILWGILATFSLLLLDLVESADLGLFSRIKPSLASTLLSAGLSAFYWLPIAFESGPAKPLLEKSDWGHVGLPLTSHALLQSMPAIFFAWILVSSLTVAIAYLAMRISNFIILKLHNFWEEPFELTHYSMSHAGVVAGAFSCASLITYFALATSTSLRHNPEPPVSAIYKEQRAQLHQTIPMQTTKGRHDLRCQWTSPIDYQCKGFVIHKSILKFQMSPYPNWQFTVDKSLGSFQFDGLSHTVELSPGSHEFHWTLRDSLARNVSKIVSLFAAMVFLVLAFRHLGLTLQVLQLLKS